MIHPVSTLGRLGALCCALALGGCSPSDGGSTAATDDAHVGPVAPRLVLFISVDTLRADFLGAYGNPWIQTQHLDALAKRSVVMGDYMTVVPTTLASHSSMFTGLYPHGHGAPRNAYTLPDLVETLPEVLKAAGYYTAGVIAASPLQHTFNFHQGFDVFEDRGVPKSGDVVVDQALGLLDGMPDDRPSFLFLHFWDPHHTYEAQEPWYGRYAADVADEVMAGWGPLSRAKDDAMRDDMLRYASEVSFVDSQIGRLMAELEVRDLRDDALIVFTSDHGEGFGDHLPHDQHGDHVFQEQIQVPCLINFPAGTVPAGTVDRPVASVDLMPTLLSALGLAAPGGIDGRAALTLAGEATAPEGSGLRFCEATAPHLGLKSHPLEEGTRWLNERKRRCAREGSYKYVYYPGNEMVEGGDGVPMLFDLATDPDETTNLLEVDAAKYRNLTGRLHSALMEWTFEQPGIEVKVSSDMTPADIKALEALGYL